MISFLGSSLWKQKTAEACSWIGLTETSAYLGYVNNLSNPQVTLGIIQIAGLRNYVNNANSDCNGN